MKQALILIRKKLINTIASLSEFAEKYKALPTLAYTHYQPAQPTTVGKRATLWLNDLVMDLEDLDYVLDSLRLLGSKGTPAHRPLSWSSSRRPRKMPPVR